MRGGRAGAKPAPRASSGSRDDRMQWEEEGLCGKLVDGNKGGAWINLRGRPLWATPEGAEKKRVGKGRGRKGKYAS